MPDPIFGGGILSGMRLGREVIAGRSSVCGVGRLIFRGAESPGALPKASLGVAADVTHVAAVDSGGKLCSSRIVVEAVEKTEAASEPPSDARVTESRETGAPPGVVTPP